MAMTKQLISPKELKKILNNNNLKILDSRWFLNESQKGLKDFKKSHIPNAIFFDIEKNSNQQIELPHMIPKKNQFEKYLNKNGIYSKNLIVIYDQSGFFSSARVWFMLRYFGFKNVKILEQGFQGWLNKNYPVTKLIKQHEKKKNKIIEKKELIKDKEFISKNLRKDNLLIIDARSEKRFLGLEKEKRPNLYSGNIPGSINIPYTSLSKNGKFLKKNNLMKIFKKSMNLDKKKNIVCTCGSGITACNIILALDILGFNNYNLYDGSWAEWGKK